MNAFDPLFKFEAKIANFFGAPFAVATDCCTHALELCLRLEGSFDALCPTHTYISVPFMLKKINMPFKFIKNEWSEYYNLTDNVIDAAVLWRKNSYIKGTMMCLSFQIKKHLKIGKGGMILLDDWGKYKQLQRMRYDGRLIYEGVSYEDDTFSEIGYHYYMTPEDAQRGLDLFYNVKDEQAKIISFLDYSDISISPIFN